MGGGREGQINFWRKQDSLPRSASMQILSTFMGISFKLA
jgi:hypothetical protein